MLAYEPDESLAHSLDPRVKLAVETTFVASAFVHSSPAALAALTVVAAGCCRAARLPVRRALWDVRLPLVALAVAALVAGVTLGSPWFRTDRVVSSAIAGYQVALALLVAAAYVRSTPLRHSRGAVQWLVPGRPGRALGVGVGLVFRFLPVLLADLRTIREAQAARLGSQRGRIERAALLSAVGLARAFDRADRLATALQARCFAWNPTLPELSFARRDLPAAGLAFLLAAAFVLESLPGAA